MNRLLRRWKSGCLLFVAAGIAIAMSNAFVREMTRATLPTHLHGRVVDQNGAGVPQADIRILYHFLFSNAERHVMTDADGKFSAWLWFSPEIDVTASKTGHVSMERRDGKLGSREKFRFLKKGRGNYQLIDPEHPPVLHVWKQGPLERVIKVPQHRMHVQAGGVMESFSFHPQNPLSPHAVEVGFWIIEDKVDARGRHDWRCEVRVPHGVLVRRRDERDFTAPESGYTSSVSAVVSPGARPEWTGTSGMRGDYFVRFDDGIFARCKVIVISAGKGDDQYVLFESVLNPKAGSRNLEVDLSRSGK
jgi:hypothetical protein